MSGKHSEPLRGLSAIRSPLFQGRFGRMFRNLPPAQFGKSDAENEKNLKLLGAKMSADFDPPRDDVDDEESGIPALYTYFGQFVDHDITFDPMSVLIKQNDPDGLVDFRNPALDLDNVYGRGPGDQPYMYDGHMFQLGEALSGSKFKVTDLPRFRGRALIGDPRNDENTIVSQLQGLFLRFHNRLVDENRDAPFEDIQRLVRFHYQYVILNDFLPRIVSKNVLEDLKAHGQYDRSKLKFFHWKNNPFMPVEFSVAAYRLGHSMIRPGYRLNDDDSTLLPIFPVEGKFADGLTGFQEIKDGRAIDWGRLIDIDLRDYDGPVDAKKKRLQFAYRIDTSLVNPLSNLPPAVVSKDDPPPSLAARNLLRAWRLGLPSGQSVAHAMYLKPLSDSEILIGKAVDKPEKPLENIVTAAGRVFSGNCPLWTYVLAEAIRNQEPVKLPVTGDVTVNTPKLGPVGGRIVAEVFVGLMFGDGNSLLSKSPGWVPKSGPQYALKDLVNFALGL